MGHMLSDSMVNDYYARFEAEYGTLFERTQRQVTSDNVISDPQLESLAILFRHADQFYVRGVNIIPPVEFDPHGLY